MLLSRLRMASLMLWSSSLAMTADCVVKKSPLCAALSFASVYSSMLLVRLLICSAYWPALDAASRSASLSPDMEAFRWSATALL